MKLYVIFLLCLYKTSAITVHYKTNLLPKNNAVDRADTLKDITQVNINQRNSPAEQSSPEESLTAPKLTNQPSRTRGGHKRYATTKPNISRIGQPQTYFQEDENHKQYMQKMADQLYIAQKHASLLSDYQKFIINQDPHVKSFVLGPVTQSRTPKPFSRSKHNGRALPVAPFKVKEVTANPSSSPDLDLNRIVVVTPKVKTTPRKMTKNDHLVQSTNVQYVTAAPQTITHFAEAYEPTQKVTLVPYYTPQPYTYYDLGVTAKPQIEAVHVPQTLTVGLESYSTPQTDVESVKNHHANPKYEFMYKVKDNEKNSHFGHMESRTDKATYGYYYVHLPDGRVETVKYWADKTGYHAKVDYEGEAKHPQTTEHKLHSHHNFAHY